MFTNATVTITRRGEAIDQTTGRSEAETPETILQDAQCVVSQSKSTRQRFTDGIREMTKPSYSMQIETYQDITIETGDQAEITMRGSDNGIIYTVNDAILSVGIRRRVWKCDIERIRVPAGNE